MGDLQSKSLIFLKGFLFLMSGVLAVGLLIAEHPEFKTIVLLSMAIWCFARFYYFAFYVIEHYVDPGYRFAGLFDFAKYLLKRTF